MMVPREPTAQPWVASVKATDMSQCGVPDVWVVQCAPPSVVARMVPREPTAQPWVASVKATEVRLCVVPDVWLVQCAPPSVVAKMVPPGPTAQPWVASMKVTELSWLPCGSGFCQDQVPAAQAIDGAASSAKASTPMSTMAIAEPCRPFLRIKIPSLLPEAHPCVHASWYRSLTAPGSTPALQQPGRAERRDDHVLLVGIRGVQ